MDERGAQARCLAPVRVVAQQRERQVAHAIGGGVVRAVVHHDDARAELQRRLGEPADRGLLVEGRDDDPDPIPEFQAEVMAKPATPALRPARTR